MAELTLEIRIIGASNILSGGWNGKLDGYVTFETSGTNQQKIKVYKNSLNPEWKSSYAKPKKESPSHSK